MDDFVKMVEATLKDDRDRFSNFLSLVKRMREAQKRQEYTDSTLDRKAMYECRKLTKQRESEVDEYLNKMAQAGSRREE